MEQKHNSDTKNLKGLRSVSILPKEGEISYVLYISLLILYSMLTFILMRVMRSSAVVMIKGNPIPATAFTGVLSSIANLSIILMVVFLGRLGFITGMIILVLNFPLMIVSLITGHNSSSIPGFFTNVFTIITILLIYRRNLRIAKYQSTEMEHLKEKQKFSQHLFEQTATALVNAVDAKDEYSHGHSIRVAEYSEKIARQMGKSEDECYKIYYSALLHDVGKIGIDDSIINKNGRLTAEEYEIIKQHPIKGNQILSSINEYPYLSIGAHYHHERYDGKGYPDGLKGDDIPEIARIISVADAYDAMTSNRSYRSAIPQDLVREEIIKGAGTQFDSVCANIMRHLIDLDTDYEMKERRAIKELAGKDGIVCDDYRSEISDGIVITPFKKKIKLSVRPLDGHSKAECNPEFIIFDALDGRVHDDEKTMEDLLYFEYGEVWLNGKTAQKGARKIKTDIQPKNDPIAVKDETEYYIEAVKFKDHVQIKIDDGIRDINVIMALPDSARYAYIGITGEHCIISDVNISETDFMIGEEQIPRIAEEISYIKENEGDIPNIQVNGYRYTSTKGIPITDGLEISFHTMSLPTARLVWHCSYIDIFHSSDGMIGSNDYTEYSLIRLDGENWESEGCSENKLIVNRTEDFNGWDAWKKANKEGYYCHVRFERDGDKIITSTVNQGISLTNITLIKDGQKDIYMALTGDQCAITDIRINSK